MNCFVSFLVILSSCVVIGFAQADSPKATADQTSVVNVNEISLNMVVRKKNGKLVPDLKPTDISVTDGGTPVKISNLRLATSDGDHLLTLVFDQLGLAAGHNAREIAKKILRTVPQNGFSFCVMRAQARLMLYQDFTADRVSLLAAIASATEEEKPGVESGAVAAEKRLLAIVRSGSDEAGIRVTDKERATDSMLLASLKESQKVMQELHTQPGLAGLLALARTEQRIPGRKTVLFFVQGLTSDGSTESRIKDIVGAANRAGVSIYVIDASEVTAQIDESLVAMMAIGGQRAAMAQAPAAATTTAGAGGLPQTVPQGPPGLAPMVGNQYERFESADPNANRSPLFGLAENTGGGYIASGEDIKKPLRRMIEDMTTYYEASYVPPITNFDGQFRPIAVKPLRAGLTIRARGGYFALPPDSGRTIRPFEAPLLKVLAESQLPSDIAVHAQILQLGDMPTGNENAIVVEVPMNSLQTKDDPNANLYSLHITVVAQIKNKAGVVVEHFGEDIPRHGSLDSKGQAQSGIVTVQRPFSAEPGEYVLETAVLDQFSGKVGAQRQEFTIASPAPGPSLSDITMVRRLEPVPEEADPDDPMRYGDGKVVAMISDTIRQGTKDLSFFSFVHAEDSAEQPRLEMEVLKSGETITQVPLALRKISGAATIPYMASIQAAGLPSGDYEVIERLTQNGQTAERSLPFRIQGNDSTSEAAEQNGTGAKDEADAVTTSGLQLPVGDGPGGHRLVIASLPPSAVPAPTPDQLRAIIAGARTRAIEYGKRLPNFICIEVTNRSVDQSGNGNWKPRDSIAEMLAYRDNAETRTTLEVNGRRSHLTRAQLNSTWPFSVGEFGAMLNLVFQPSSKTAFEWKEAASLGEGNGTLQVLSYRVARENATIVLTQGNDQASVGFHGLIYIDSTTGGVRRVTLEADGVPHSFAIHGASMTVDYDYVAIADRDYLLPVRSTVRLVRGRRKVELNEIAFRNYRRFASRSRLKIAQ